MAFDNLLAALEILPSNCRPHLSNQRSRLPGLTGRSTGKQQRRDDNEAAPSGLHWLHVHTRYGAFLACSANAAPCGSNPFTIQSPPGTSIGPLRIWPPFAVMRSTADVMSGTRK